jgi:aspartyl-tRNA(Asn)/glutamyl-tRNA(Gln) amidotransferase subunit A
LDPEVESNFNDSIRVLEKFSTIEEIEFPDLPYEAITRIILNSEAASAFENLAESGTVRGLTAPVDRYGIYPRTVVLAKDYIKALRLRGIMAQEAEEHMAPFDAVVAPARNSPASPIGSEFRKKAPGTQRDIMGALGNGAGLPSISVPNGFTELGLPTGIQFMGRAYDENKILDVAKAYQKQTHWHTMHPEI